MTDTVARGAANQAGARVNKDAYAEAQDFLPLKGIDYVEFWVGNARQASAYYRALWGFTPVAFAGLETGIRDRASYVMRRNDITFVFTAPLTPEGEIAGLDAGVIGKSERLDPSISALCAAPRHEPSLPAQRHPKHRRPQTWVHARVGSRDDRVQREQRQQGADDSSLYRDVRSFERKAVADRSRRKPERAQRPDLTPTLADRADHDHRNAGDTDEQPHGEIALEQLEDLVRHRERLVHQRRDRERLGAVPDELALQP